MIVVSGKPATGKTQMLAKLPSTVSVSMAQIQRPFWDWYNGEDYVIVAGTSEADKEALHKAMPVGKDMTVHRKGQETALLPTPTFILELTT